MILDALRAEKLFANRLQIIPGRSLARKKALRKNAQLGLEFEKGIGPA
jgi:hypothetical protein